MEYGLLPNVWMVLPFLALLVAIAIGPLFFPQWWLRHYPKLAIGLGLITVAYYLVGLDATARVLHTSRDYVSFIVLIGSLFVVSGGIHIRVEGQSTPLVNTLFLLFGAVIANLIGTTGASMLLIRPWLRMNQPRTAAHHVVFFIFIVSNVGGCLTPIGDPPLFLGYLKGVPFWWVFEHCWRIWLCAIAVLLSIFYAMDRRHYLRSPLAAVNPKQVGVGKWKVDGLANLVFLSVILASVFISHPLFLREAIMLAAAAASYFTTPKSVHFANEFNFHPVREVAILFAGIFATMMPALDYLGASAKSLGISEPSFFYWGSGLLSSVLDNAPTYLAFFEVAKGSVASPLPVTSESAATLALLGDPVFANLLVAISVGAVFFGANTYIGNGPNFMVKAIAEQSKVPTPTFLGYLKYSLLILMPVLTIIWWIFIH